MQIKNYSKKFLVFILFPVVFFLCSCGFDAGLLDNNSKVSRQRESEIVQKSEDFANALRLDDVAVDWFGSLCNTTTYFKNKLDPGDKNGGSQDANYVKNRYVQLFLTNSEVSKNSAIMIRKQELPDLNRDRWVEMDRKITRIFDQLASVSRGHAEEIQAVDAYDVGALEDVITRSANDWSAHLKTFNDDLTSVLSDVPFPNQKTAIVAQNLPQCKAQSETTTNN